MLSAAPTTLTRGLGGVAKLGMTGVAKLILACLAAGNVAIGITSFDCAESEFLPVRIGVKFG
jgi:hypothetical protein